MQSNLGTTGSLTVGSIVRNDVQELLEKDEAQTSVRNQDNLNDSVAFRLDN